jgi:uncharacterized membrane protein
LALITELDREFLSVAIVMQMLAISWINNQLSIKALRSIIVVLACIFGLLLLPQIILIIQLVLYSLVGAKIYLQASLPIVKWPIFQLGVPAIAFFTSSYLLRRQQYSKIIDIFEIITISLITIMGYYITRNILNPNENILFIKAGFFERGIITNILFIYGLLCLYISRKFKYITFSQSGIFLCFIAIFRIIYFDILFHNPIFKSEKIEGIIIFNSLLLTYCLPLIWLYFVKKELFILKKDKWIEYIGIFMILIIFTLISLNIRYIFQGEYLNKNIITNAEIYSYSVVWLIFGIMLLFSGIIQQNKILRYASLVIISITVLKVFLYDALELKDLYRVLSFFGLGISLIGLSYVYTRFVK